MNKTYKYTLTAHEKKEISFDTGVARLAIANGDGVDGSTTVIMSEITKQHSGDIVSFLDGADAPFADFIVNIVAQQSGSGDPSPQNERPITGWTGVNIFAVNQNLFDGEMELGALTSTGENTPSNSSIRCKNYIAIKNVKEIYRHWDTTQVSSSYILWYAYKADKTFSRYLGAQTVPNNVILNSDERYLRFYIYNRTEALPSFMINYGSSALSYVAYSNNSENINIDWQGEAGTVYGGTLNVKTGVLTVTHRIIQGDEWDTIQEIKKNDTSNPDSWLYLLQTRQFDYSSAAFCSHLTDEQSTPSTTIGMRRAMQYYCIYMNFLDAIGTNDVSHFRTYCKNNNVQLVMKLATPVTYQLTPTEIRSLLGINNVWADCGPVNVRYFVQSTQPMIDYIDDKTPVFFDADYNYSTSTVSLINGVTSTDIKNYLTTHKNANVFIKVRGYSSVEMYRLRDYSANYFADFASPANVFDADGIKSTRIDYLRLDLTQETSDFTTDYIIVSGNETDETVFDVTFSNNTYSLSDITAGDLYTYASTHDNVKLKLATAGGASEFFYLTSSGAYYAYFINALFTTMPGSQTPVLYVRELHAAAGDSGSTLSVVEKNIS